MKSLLTRDQLWRTFDDVSVNGRLFITKRLLLSKLTSDGQPVIYLAVNALSGAVDFLTAAEGAVLEDLSAGHTSTPNGLSHEFLEELRLNGYLFSSDAAEESIYREIVNSWTTRRIAESDLLVFMALDTLCKMGCSYCFQRQAGGCEIELENSVMTPTSLGRAFEALDQIQKETRRRVKWIVLFGGEPLQERLVQSVDRCIGLAKERNHEVVAFSNMAMIGQRLRRTIASHRKAITWIETTIDGTAEVHNDLRLISSAYERTVYNIQAILDLGISITVRTNINPDNIEMLPRLGEAFDALGWYANPRFKHIVALCTDRHLLGGRIFREDSGYSRFLRIRDEHPIVHKMKDYNIVYILFHLALALKTREIIGGVDYRTDLRPVVVHCPTGAGSELVFTGEPQTPGQDGYSIYCCAECGSSLEKKKPFRVGRYFPALEFFGDACEAWGGRDYLSLERSIRTIPQCAACNMALFCGGACSLESINANGTAMVPNCREAEDVILSFMHCENDRLYGIGSKVLMS